MGKEAKSLYFQIPAILAFEYPSEFWPVWGSLRILTILNAFFQSSNSIMWRVNILVWKIKYTKFSSTYKELQPRGKFKHKIQISK